MYERNTGTRTPWGNFPEVIRHNDIGTLRNESEYISAKQGSDMDALTLIDRMLDSDAVERLYSEYDAVKPTLLPVIAQHSLGNDKIPLAMSCILADKLGWDIELDVVVSCEFNRTGFGSVERLALYPDFVGRIEKGGFYVLLDDSIVLGGTIASLKGHVERHGGNVLCASVMQCHKDSINLKPESRHLKSLESNVGANIDSVWRDRFGWGIECLTRQEARTLTRAIGQNVTKLIDEVRN